MLKLELSGHQELLLETGRALDIELIGDPIGDGDVWELYGYLDNVEYIWGSTGEYAESIGRNKSDGRYFASKDHRFRNHPVLQDNFTCVWYR